MTCWCGSIEWTLNETAPPIGIRYTCYCNDCQAFAHYTGNPDDILDPNGGTDAYQLPVSNITLVTGQDHLRCVHMTSRRLLRWYCNTCMAPVANTYNTSKMSFASMPLAVVPPETRDTVLGPSSGHVWAKFSKTDLSRTKAINIPAMLWRMISRIIQARLSGDFRNNPFFSVDSGQPICDPHRLNGEARSHLDQQTRIAPKL